MRNSKYGKFLTVLLIIAIIAIVGLLIFFGIDMYQKYYLDSQAEKVLEQFEGSLVTGNEEENNNTTNTQNTTDNPFSELEDVNFAGGGSSSNVVMYEDYIDLINIDINCPLYFEAPLSANSKLGSINLNVSDTINFEYPIYNSYEVKRKNWNIYFIDFFKDYSSTLSNLFL